jgi:putative membrane protein
MNLDALAFVIEVAIFTGVMVLAEPLLRKLAFTHARALLGSTAMLATLIALIATDLLSDGLTISGAGTWLLATILIWGFAVIARLLVPLVLFKETLGRRDAAR